MEITEDSFKKLCDLAFINGELSSLKFGMDFEKRNKAKEDNYKELKKLFNY